MLKLYCQKCGALNTYVSEKPNFCQKCGQSFGAATETAAPNQETTNKIVKAPQQPQSQPPQNNTYQQAKESGGQTNPYWQGDPGPSSDDIR